MQTLWVLAKGSLALGSGAAYINAAMALPQAIAAIRPPTSKVAGDTERVKIFPER